MEQDKKVFSKADRSALRQIRRSSSVSVSVQDDGVLSSPDIRRYAAEKGVDLSEVVGHGIKGKITKSDIDDYLKRIEYFDQMQQKYQQQKKKTSETQIRAFRAENIFESDGMTTEDSEEKAPEPEVISEAVDLTSAETEHIDDDFEEKTVSVSMDSQDEKQVPKEKKDDLLWENPWRTAPAISEEPVREPEPVRYTAKPKHYGFVTTKPAEAKPVQPVAETVPEAEPAKDTCGEETESFGFDYDVIIIGCGLSGFETALCAAREGLKTAVVEKSEPGGKALRDGMIPIAYLRQNAAFISECGKFVGRGVAVNAMSLDLPVMMRDKAKKIQRIRENMTKTLKDLGIDFYSGHGEIKDAHTVSVLSKEKKVSKLHGSNLVAATGTTCRIPEDYARLSDIFTDGQAHDLERLPAEMVIIGSGAAVCEYAAFYSVLGSKIFVITSEESLLPGFDRDIQQLAEDSLKDMRVEIHYGVQITDSYRDSDGNLHIEIQNAQGVSSLVCSDCFVIRERMPNLKAVSSMRPAVMTGQNGFLVDERGETSCPGLYAVGSVVGDNDRTAVPSEIIAAITGKFNSKQSVCKPICINTFPQIAVIGLNEKEAERQEKDVKIARLDAKTHMGFLMQDHSQGMIKVIADSETDVILGAAICCENAFEVIGMIQAVMTLNGTVEDLKRISCHPFSAVAFAKNAVLMDD